jgi:hypothetical protein
MSKKTLFSGGKLFPKRSKKNAVYFFDYQDEAS